MIGQFKGILNDVGCLGETKMDRIREVLYKGTLFLFILLWVLPARAFSGEVRVIILPLKVYAKEEIEDFRVKIEEIIETRLAEEGIQAMRADLLRDRINFPLKGEYNAKMARKLDKQIGVDYVVWGGLTKLGERISLDLRLSPVKKAVSTSSHYIEGAGAEEIIEKTDDLMEEMIARLLGRKKVLRVEVSGNRRIGDAAILIKSKVREGDYYSRKKIQEDIKVIEKMDYFEDVRVEVSDLPEGMEITYVVKERSTIREVLITGNDEISTDDIKEVISIQPRSILNMNAVKESEKRILELYREKGYYAAKVHHEIKELEEKQAGVIFRIEEGAKSWIREITFKGNEAVSEEDLEAQMETKEKGWFYWITDSGIYKKEILKQDVEKLAAYYYNNGYIKARIGEPVVMLKEELVPVASPINEEEKYQVFHVWPQPDIFVEGKGFYKEEWIYIMIPIHEGDQYKTGEVHLQGDFIEKEEDLQKKVEIAQGEVFNRGKVRKTVMAMTEIYADQGYAHADIVPKTVIDDEKKIVKVTFDIRKKEKVYFGKIRIFGNTKTRDKVIRRELLVNEGDLFSSSLLKGSFRNLKNLRYFEDVVFQTAKGETEDTLDLTIEVKEKSTGSFSIGAGFSSVDKLMGMAEISQSNLFGKGYKLRLKANVGSTRRFFDLTFIEPWLLDTPVTFRGDLYNSMREYTDYTRKAKGGRVLFVIPLDTYFYTSLGYGLEEVEVTDVNDDAASDFKDQVGKSTTSKIETGLIWDSRDNKLYPSKGTNSRFDIFFAGPGGDNYYIKYVLRSSWYFSVFWDTVFMTRGIIGYGHGWNGQELPVFERFFLGGINTIRGFETSSIGPTDPETGDVIGGDREILFNLEYIFPIEKKLELRGVLFYDRGNAYLGEADLSDMRHSVGFGIRWFSPLGPLRLEWGYNLDPRGDEDHYEWAFTVGGTF